MGEPIETDEEFMDGISPHTIVIDWDYPSISDKIVEHIYELFGDSNELH